VSTGHRLAAALGLLLLAGPSRAQEQGASPMSGSFEFRVGGYKPNIDAGPFKTPPAIGPWESTFGGSRPLRFDLQVARALPWRNYGTVEVGLGAGWFRATGHGLKLDNEVSPDSTSFQMVPVALSLTYRPDVLFDRLGIPLVPYARVALQRYNWWVTGTTGSTSKSGATSGYSYGGGLAFVLDWVDSTLARELDHDTGINHTMVFVDLAKTKVDNFGSRTSWDLSDTSLTYSFGLMFVY